ncbi:hypothetical protein EDC04DRAFT_2599971 [Pisolithus marmoratus]|nr:hypothetical protein EDC04DRAFT_2599971 [Pisolithus marmoratus]
MPDNFKFIAQWVENNVYMLTTNGYQAVNLEGNLFGALELPPQEWVIMYRENHDAYMIIKKTNAPQEIRWVTPTKDKSCQVWIWFMILVQPLTRICQWYSKIQDPMHVGAQVSFMHVLLSTTPVDSAAILMIRSAACHRPTNLDETAKDFKGETCTDLEKFHVCLK